MSNKNHIHSTPVARSVPYDDQNIPTNLGDDVQTAIDSFFNQAAVSASPGFTWGSSGNTTSGSWFVNDTVPSNKTGRIFPLYNGTLEEIAVSNEVSNTFTVELYEHDGTTFTLLASASVVAARSTVATFTGINITRGKELAVLQASGSSKNAVVQIIAKGTKTP